MYYYFKFRWAALIFIVNPSYAQYLVELQEPIGSTSALAGANGFDLIIQYISAIYMFLASIVGIIAVLMIVFAGIQIVFAGAHEALRGAAIARIKASLLSLVLLFGMALLLKTVNPVFFGGGGAGVSGILGALIGSF